ncbi:MAG: cytidylate kinase family protein, partial [Halanaeroarchaeum sp.]
AGWMAGEYADIRVWLDAPEDVRAARVADREDVSIEEARRTLHARAESEVVRYRRYYGIDFSDRSIYDLSVNTARWKPDGVMELVRTAVSEYDLSEDEGAFPIEGVDYEF